MYFKELERSREESAHISLIWSGILLCCSQTGRRGWSSLGAGAGAVGVSPPDTGEVGDARCPSPDGRTDDTDRRGALQFSI